MSINLCLQLASAQKKGIPSKKSFLDWLKIALLKQKAEITIRIVDEKESAKLSETYRDKKGATNILTFPYDDEKIVSGDLIIAKAIVEQEAKKQHKNIKDHYAHLTLHGCLHLLGYDHQNEKEALAMESKEIELLKKLGIKNPYEH